MKAFMVCIRVSHGFLNPNFVLHCVLPQECDVGFLRRVNMYKHEHFLLCSDKYARTNGAILRRCTLEDFTSFSFGPFQQWNMAGFKFVIFSELDPNYWPEEVGRLHAVYAPWLIGTLDARVGARFAFHFFVRVGVQWLVQYFR
jgi:hypothetical protein